LQKLLSYQERRHSPFSLFFGNSLSFCISLGKDHGQPQQFLADTPPQLVAVKIAATVIVAE
jgi:hypothetical protein